MEEIFEILSACAALHPSIMPAEEEEEGWFGETDEIEEQAPSLSETGRVRADLLSCANRFNPY